MPIPKTLFFISISLFQMHCIFERNSWYILL
jgi:hypothetical protein